MAPTSWVIFQKEWNEKNEEDDLMAIRSSKDA